MFASDKSRRREARSTSVFAVVLAATVACGGQSVDRETRDDPGGSASGARGPSVGESGGATSGTGGMVGGSSGSTTGGNVTAGGTATGGGVAAGGVGGSVTGTGGTVNPGKGGGGEDGEITFGKGSAVVRQACGEFCRATPASCPAATEPCSSSCIHAGNDSPSVISEFAAYVTCIAAHMDPAAICDESCSGAEGCAGEAIAACDLERLAWQARFDECGTTTSDYESPSWGCRRSSACNDQVVECGSTSNDFDPASCKCFNFSADGITGPVMTSGDGDACLEAARMCQGL